MLCNTAHIRKQLLAGRLRLAVFISGIHHGIIGIHQFLNIIGNGIHICFKTKGSRSAFRADCFQVYFKSIVDGKCIGIGTVFRTV